ncbi:YjfB family protein [Aneurinibacillus tyrosinisolvens]|uniref:YjfB family protein n=1 Tax=Aneurinibacillus tyrosinisolvens TaxID=1443435 RepID=UPI0009E4A50F|nr:YjfB family protein [Aneurinibacillus tyrosinisolvens]
MDIAAVATNLKAISIGSQVGIAVTKKVMDSQKADGEQMIQLLERSVSPNLGGNIDTRI